MTFSISDTALLKSEESNLTPNLVLQIDGVSTIYGTAGIDKVAVIGEPGLKIGVAFAPSTTVWKIGGTIPLADQETLVSYSSGTSQTIRQTLRQDIGTGESISSMVVALIDKDNEITNLITPGNVVTDLLGRKAKIYFGFDETAFKDDYILVFSGNVDEISSRPGVVQVNIVSPDVKKKSQVFAKGDTTLTAGINDSVTTIPVDDTGDFLFPVTGPDGSIDTTIKFYVRIDDEIMRYETGTGTTFTTVTRGALQTTAATHSDEATVESIYRLTSTITDIALKFMMSGLNGPYIEDETITNFVRTNATTTVANSIFFNKTDVESEFGIVIGDFITTTGASNGANNVTLKAINGIITTSEGSYITIAGVTFVEENDTAGVIDFRSQYDSWGEGLSMGGDQVDVAEHERLNGLFLSNFDYDFLLRDTIDNGKEFLGREIYSPAAAFSLPRKAKASMGYHIGPLPTTTIKILDTSNILNPSGLSITRSTSKNFFNAITYAFNEDTLNDKFLRGVITTSATSLSRIPVGNKSLTFKSKGLRGFNLDTGAAESGESQAISASNRRLKKFKFGAEFVRGIKVNLKTGWTLEIGDIVQLDLPSLKMSDIVTGDRDGEARLFEITNKIFNLKTGLVTLDVVDTNFDKDARFGLISPASQVAAGVSATQFTIKGSFGSKFGINEFKKWSPYIGAGIKVHNTDFSVSGTSTLQSLSGNTVTLSSSLGFTPAVDYVMSFDTYNTQPATVFNIYTFMRDSAFDSGAVQYTMI